MYSPERWEREKWLKEIAAEQREIWSEFFDDIARRKLESGIIEVDRIEYEDLKAYAERTGYKPRTRADVLNENKEKQDGAGGSADGTLA